MFASELMMWIFTLGVLVGAIVSMEIGRRLGRKHFVQEPETARTGLGAIDGAIYQRKNRYGSSHSAGLSR
jgi:hypothetical protein